jgi:hypothetical protein
LEIRRTEPTASATKLARVNNQAIRRVRGRRRRVHRGERRWTGCASKKAAAKEKLKEIPNRDSRRVLTTKKQPPLILEVKRFYSPWRHQDAEGLIRRIVALRFIAPQQCHVADLDPNTRDATRVLVQFRLSACALLSSAKLEL